MTNSGDIKDQADHNLERIEKKLEKRIEIAESVIGSHISQLNLLTSSVEDLEDNSDSLNRLRDEVSDLRLRFHELEKNFETRGRNLDRILGRINQVDSKLNPIEQLTEIAARGSGKTTVPADALKQMTDEAIKWKQKYDDLILRNEIVKIADDTRDDIHSVNRALREALEDN